MLHVEVSNSNTVVVLEIKSTCIINIIWLKEFSFFHFKMGRESDYYVIFCKCRSPGYSMHTDSLHTVFL